MLSAGEVVLGRSLEELQVLVKAAGQPAFRAKQLRDGVLQGARNLGDITNLPKSFRAQLQEQVGAVHVTWLTVSAQSQSLAGCKLHSNCNDHLW